VIERPAIAQTQLQQRPRNPGDQPLGHVEARALGAKAADNAVKSAHVSSLVCLMLIPLVSAHIGARVPTGV
jgi:hypothetical protein